MADLVIRDIPPDLEQTISEFARQSGRTMSAEARFLLRRGILHDERAGLGTKLCNLVDDDLRGDDLVFQYKGPPCQPPEFE